MIKKHIASLSLLIFGFALPALADNTASTDATECHAGRGAISILPTWYHVSRDNYSSAFTSNGFNTPSNDRVGLGLLLYWITASDWQIGLGLSGFSLNQDVGANQASYSDDYIGIYFAKNFTPNEDFDITLGALIGGGHANLEVFSGVKNGKYTETSAVLEPRLGFAYRISRYAKLGLMGSYLFPFAPSSDLKGQDLGVNDISARGVEVGAQLILGRFDLASK